MGTWIRPPVISTGTRNVPAAIVRPYKVLPCH